MSNLVGNPKDWFSRVVAHIKRAGSQGFDVNWKSKSMENSHHKPRNSSFHQLDTQKRRGRSKPLGRGLKYTKVCVSIKEL